MDAALVFDVGCGRVWPRPPISFRSQRCPSRGSPMWMYGRPCGLKASAITSKWVALSCSFLSCLREARCAVQQHGAPTSVCWRPSALHWGQPQHLQGQACSCCKDRMCWALCSASEFAFLRWTPKLNYKCKGTYGISCKAKLHCSVFLFSMLKLVSLVLGTSWRGGLRDFQKNLVHERYVWGLGLHQVVSTWNIIDRKFLFLLISVCWECWESCYLVDWPILWRYSATGFLVFIYVIA